MPVLKCYKKGRENLNNGQNTTSFSDTLVKKRQREIVAIQTFPRSNILMLAWHNNKI